MRRGCITRRGLLAAAAAWPLLPARAAELPAAHHLKDELAAALARRQPLVIMVSLEGCPFCKVARDHYLVPLHQQEGVPIAQVDMRSRTRVYDFQGRLVTHDDLARQWKIRIAPTVLFFGPGGVEVAERLVGGSIPDFYGAYLEQRIAAARAALR